MLLTTPLDALYHKSTLKWDIALSQVVLPSLCAYAFTSFYVNCAHYLY